VLQCVAVCCIHTSQTKHVSSCILPDVLDGHDTPITSHLSGASLNYPIRTRDLAIFFLSLSLSLSPSPSLSPLLQQRVSFAKEGTLCKKGHPSRDATPLQKTGSLAKGGILQLHGFFFVCWSFPRFWGCFAQEACCFKEPANRCNSKGLFLLGLISLSRIRAHLFVTSCNTLQTSKYTRKYAAKIVGLFCKRALQNIGLLLSYALGPICLSRVATQCRRRSTHASMLPKL